jgi:hypothetical protein
MVEHIWMIEEIKARQRSRDMEIKEGDKNTSFFAKTNYRKRKKTISCLEDDGNSISEQKG